MTLMRVTYHLDLSQVEIVYLARQWEAFQAGSPDEMDYQQAQMYLRWYGLQHARDVLEQARPALQEQIDASRQYTRYVLPP